MGGLCTHATTKVHDPKTGSAVPSGPVAASLPPAQNDQTAADLDGAVKDKAKTEADINEALIQVTSQPVLGTIETMQNFTDTKDVQKECAARLQELCAKDGQNIDTLIENNGLEPIVKAMELYLSEETLLATCTSLLQQLANTSAGQTAIAASGGLKVLVAVMNDHSDNCKLFEMCCGIFINMAKHNPNIKMRIGTLGGICSILKGMKENGDSLQVQEQACSVLRVLVPSPQNQGGMTAMGGIKVVINALETHSSAVNLQVEGCWVLRNIAYNHRRNQERIGEYGGLAVIIKAMKEHIASPELQQCGCAALRNSVVLCAVNKEVLVTLLGLHRVKHAIECHSTDVKVVEQGLWAVRDIVADCPSALAQAKEIDVAQQIESLKAVHDGCGQICSACQEALKILRD